MRRAEHLQMIKKALSGFSLNDAETSMYLSVLNGGAKPVSQVAKAAGLKRSYAYDVLESLVQKGLLLEVELNGMRRFVTTELDEVLELMNERELRLVSEKERLRSFIPTIENLRQSATSRTFLKEYSGSSGVEAVYSIMLNSPSELLRCFRADVLQVGSELRIKFDQERCNSGMWLFSLIDCAVCSASSEEELETFQKKRALTELSLDSDLYIYAQSIVLISRQKLAAATIALPMLCRAMRMLHEGYWQTSSMGSKESAMDVGNVLL